MGVGSSGAGRPAGAAGVGSSGAGRPAGAAGVGSSGAGRPAEAAGGGSSGAGRPADAAGVGPVSVGDQVSLRVTPDRYTTVRYAGASGDFNPIHIDEQFAREVGLPGRILHGLWSMAQVARAAQSLAGGDPRALRALSVQFRALGRMEQEIEISGTVTSVQDGLAGVKLEASQAGAKIVKGALAEVRVNPSPSRVNPSPSRDMNGRTDNNM